MNETNHQGMENASFSLDNSALEQALLKFQTQQTLAHFNLLLKQLGDAFVAVPCAEVAIGDQLRLLPALYQTRSGEQCYRCFTSLEQIKSKDPGTQIRVVPMKALYQLALNTGAMISFIALNPETQGIRLTPDMLTAMVEGRTYDPNQTTAGPMSSSGKMTSSGKTGNSKKGNGSVSTPEDVQNLWLEEAMEAFCQDGSDANLSAMLELVQNSEFLCPVVVKEVQGMEFPSPVLLTAKDGTTVLPVYTSKKHLGAQKDHTLAVVPFAEIAESAMKEQQKDGHFQMIVINPFTTALSLPMALLKTMVEAKAQYEAALKSNAPEGPLS